MKLRKTFTRIKKALSNIPQIYEGVVNYFIHQDDVEWIAEKRMHVCEECPDIDIEGNECLAPGSEPCCSLCGCSLHFKTRSLSSECPAGKWKAVMSEEEEEELYK